MGSAHMPQPNFSIFEPLFSPSASSSTDFMPSINPADIASRSYCSSPESRDPNTCVDGTTPSSPMPGLSTPPSRCLSMSNADKHDADDGSVACKLLSSITKSLSSPSLLSCCKESVRETPYQKSLKLRMMKLHHCAEELGSESSASTYGDGGDGSSFAAVCSKSLTTRSSAIDGCFSSALLPEMDQIAQSNPDQIAQSNPSPVTVMVSVMSAPNLGCPSLISRHRERSFPPPLAHTLPRSLSADSFTFALRACRQDGRFMLKEVKVPCRQYIRASRKDGRLTLQLFTADESNEAESGAYYGQPADAMDSHEDGSSTVSEADEQKARSCVQYNDVEKEVSNGLGRDEKGGLDECSLLSLRKTEISSNGLGFVDYFKERCLSAKCLFLRTFNADADDEATCSDAVCAMINCVRHHVPKNQSSATKTAACLPSASSFRCSTLCSKHYSPSLKVTRVLRLVHGEENTVNQCRSSRRGSVATTSKSLGLEISSAFNFAGAGLCADRSASTTIFLKDVALNSVIRDVAKLVDSFGSEGAKWCQGKMAQRELDRRCGLATKTCHHEGNSSVTDNGIRSINIGVKKLHEDYREETCGFQVLNLVHSREPWYTTAFEEDGCKLIHGVSNILSTATIHLDVQSPLHLEWLHSSHCKELLDRNLVSKGFPYVAIRS